MAHLNRPLRRKRKGALTLEWILLVTVIVIGIIGGLGAVRLATVNELIDLAGAIEAINMGPCASCCCDDDAIVNNPNNGGDPNNTGGDPNNTGGDPNNTGNGNNGIGNGIDPQPPGDPPINDGP